MPTAINISDRLHNFLLDRKAKLLKEKRNIGLGKIVEEIIFGDDKDEN